MEAAYRATENALFYNIGNTNVWSGYVNGAGNNPFGTGVTSPNDSVCRIRGSTPKEGPAIILKVMAGDIYKVGVQAYWKSGQTATGTTNAISDILSSLANGIVSVVGAAKGSYSSLSNTSTSPLLGGVNSFRSSKNPTPPSYAKAYLNYVALDNQFNYDSTASGAQAVGAPDGLRTLSDSLVIKKNGYLYIYLTNETQNVSVFFDNLSITHYSGPLLEENHYYPFGLTMAGLSDKGLKTQYAENKYRYNKGSELQNKEFSDGSGLEMYETQLRELDPQLGRWWQIDPKIDQGYENVSPYNAMNDDPVRYNDPKGDEGEGANACCDVGGALNIFKNTQKVAGAIEGLGGGPENPIADGAALIVEVGGDLWALGQLIFGPSPAPAMGIPPKTPAGTAPPGTNVVNAKKGPKDLVGEAKAAQQKEAEAASRAAKRQAATAEGKAKEGQSNQGTRGSHSSGGNKPEKHDKAEARRKKEQKAADAAEGAAKKKDTNNG